MDTQDLKNRFTYYPPKEGQPAKYVTLRDNFFDLAQLINSLAPDSREKSLAITHLEEAVTWAIKAISRNE